MCKGGVSTENVLGTASVGTQVLGGFLSADAAGKTSKGTQDAYRMQAAVDGNNAILADARAADAIERGQLTADRYRRGAKTTKHSVKASRGASGIEMDVGSPVAVFAGMDVIEAQDTATIKKNAIRESLAYTVEAQNLRSNSTLKNSRANQENPAMARTASLLGSAQQVASNSYTLYKSGAFS